MSNKWIDAFPDDPLSRLMDLNMLGSNERSMVEDAIVNRTRKIAILEAELACLRSKLSK